MDLVIVILIFFNLGYFELYIIIGFKCGIVCLLYMGVKYEFVNVK